MSADDRLQAAGEETAPQVSVITCVYNEERHLRGYLDSLCAQTYRRFELIIVDDGSTDGSCAIIEEYRKDLQIELIRQPHQGWKLAKAKALTIADGEIVVIFDADEIIEPRCLERLQAPFSDPAVGAVGGRIVAEGSGWVVEGAAVARGLMHRLRKSRGNEGWTIAAGCMALRRRAVDSVGGLTTSDRPIAQDVDISWRLKENGWKLVSVDDAVARHRDPTRLGGLFRRQFTFGRKAVHTYGRHPKVWLNWKAWVRFYPLLLVLLLPFFPLAAAVLFAATVPAAFWLLRKEEAGVAAKLRAWVVLTVHSVAYTLGFLAEVSQRGLMTLRTRRQRA